VLSSKPHARIKVDFAPARAVAGVFEVYGAAVR
jgi:hypothetical protein